MRAIASLLLSLSLLVLSCGRGARVPAAPAPAHPNGYELQLGREVFQRYCAGCHGDRGAGDGFNSFSLDPHPRDLGDPAFQKSKSNADLADAIRRGGAGVGLSVLMPPYGHTLSDRQIAAVVAFVRTLRKAA